MTPIIKLSGPHADTGTGSDVDVDVDVEIDIDHGGRVAQIHVCGIPLLIDPPTAADRNADAISEPVAWGSYPMAPWAGRVRNGRFGFFGVEHQLRLHAGSDHAMHGTVLDVPWTIEQRTGSTLDISCPLDQPGSGWLFGGVARQRVEVLADQLRVELSVSTDGAPFPAMVGWHPWWAKPVALTFHPDAMYERDAVGLPTGQLVAPTAGPWDDCFVNTAPITLHYDRPDVADITISSDCDHWVVYDEPDHATCVEPQSGPPDEFNLRPHVVTSANPLRRTMLVTW